MQRAEEMLVAYKVLLQPQVPHFTDEEMRHRIIKQKASSAAKT